MKYTFHFFKTKAILLFALILSSNLWAQAPNEFSYQAVVRDASDNLISNTQIGMQISILQGSENGTSVFNETLYPTTNMNGLISIVIGEGADLSMVDWDNGPYFIKTEIDPSGNSNFSITGTSKLLSVPYALFANTAKSFSPGTIPGEMMYWNGTEWTLVMPGNDGDILTLVGSTPTWLDESDDDDNDDPEEPSEVPTVTNPVTGKIWMDRNLGAHAVATSATDTAALGNLYQWGRGDDGHEFRNSSTTTILSSEDEPGHGFFIINAETPFDWRVPQNNLLWDGEDGINNPCPDDFRLPTENEWVQEYSTWTSNDAEGAFNSVLKLPTAGQRKFSDGEFYGVDTSGSYWSSSLSSEAGGIYSRFLSFRYNVYVISAHRATANSVRCIKD